MSGNELAQGLAQSCAGGGPGGCERQRVDKRHLPRLSPEHYRGRAAVFWAMNTEDRRTGWLTPSFHGTWREVLIHTCARFELLCPAYVLMPDHMHFVWLGTAADSDQRQAVKLLRMHLREALSPTVWQRCAYDHVLNPKERKKNSFQRAVHYSLENPVRAGLSKDFLGYPYLGCCLPGYPEFRLNLPDFWERFWRTYNFLTK